VEEFSATVSLTARQPQRRIEQISSAYNSYRTFIMGTKNQPMFPNGVVYEGVNDEVSQASELSSWSAADSLHLSLFSIAAR
jgi:hypothetical protein